LTVPHQRRRHGSTNAHREDVDGPVEHASNRQSEVGDRAVAFRLKIRGVAEVRVQRYAHRPVVAERPRQGVVLATEQPGDAVEHEPRCALAASFKPYDAAADDAAQPARGEPRVGRACDAGRQHAECPGHDARQRQAEGRVRPELWLAPTTSAVARLVERPRAAPGQRDVAFDRRRRRINVVGPLRVAEGPAQPLVREALGRCAQQ